MARIFEQAQFNRKSLLYNYADFFQGNEMEVKVPDFPGDDYIKASKLVWVAMRSLALDQDNSAMHGNNDRPGFLLRNATMADTVRLLWPTMHDHLMPRVMQAIGTLLKRSDNAMNLGRSETSLKKRGAEFDWWVAAEWQDPDSSVKITKSGTTKPRRRIKPKPAQKPAAKIKSQTEVTTPEQPVEAVSEDLVANASAPVAGDAPTAGWNEWFLDQVSILTQGVSSLMRENQSLRNDKAALEQRLETIKSNIMGEL